VLQSEKMMKNINPNYTTVVPARCNDAREHGATQNEIPVLYDHVYFQLHILKISLEAEVALLP
jgi:hypothetical protein